jgi:hypothetical protein
VPHGPIPVVAAIAALQRFDGKVSLRLVSVIEPLQVETAVRAMSGHW